MSGTVATLQYMDRSFDWSGWEAVVEDRDGKQLGVVRKPSDLFHLLGSAPKDRVATFHVHWQKIKET